MKVEQDIALPPRERTVHPAGFADPARAAAMAGEATESESLAATGSTPSRCPAAATRDWLPTTGQLCYGIVGINHKTIAIRR
jgi:hypothetical protein